MTPLAQKIARQALRDGYVDAHLAEARCFEVTEVLGLVEDYLKATSALDKAAKLETWAKTAFLPAPTCWFEWVHTSGARRGFLIGPIDKGFQQTGVGRVSHILFGRDDYLDDYSILGWIDLDDLSKGVFPAAGDRPAGYTIEGAFVCILCILAIINTPKIVGRREHAPHKGLAKTIRQAHGKAYQLRPWTEIKLEITPPPGGDGSREVLTGKKALHFCRAHLRIRRGKLERVTSHWRGDPALGIVRSRYSVSA